MVSLTVGEVAALSRIASRLASLLANSNIVDLARRFRVRLDGSNKHDQMVSLLVGSWNQTTAREMERVIATATMAAYQRHTAGQASMREDDVNSIVADMRRIGLEPGQLANRGWRKNLRPSSTGVHAPFCSLTRNKGPARKAHPEALALIQKLVDPATDPQARGRQLESILFGVLRGEGLSPERNVVLPGEQVDLGFILDGQHYLAECKWEAAHVGTATLLLFCQKVERRAEGTFGVVLSMSGFVEDINVKASRGRRLNCIGITGQQFMEVLEGRVTWSDLVAEARTVASRRGLFIGEVSSR